MYFVIAIGGLKLFVCLFVCFVLFCFCFCLCFVLFCIVLFFAQIGVNAKKDPKRGIKETISPKKILLLHLCMRQRPS